LPETVNWKLSVVAYEVSKLCSARVTLMYAKVCARDGPSTEQRVGCDWSCAYSDALWANPKSKPKTGREHFNTLNGFILHLDVQNPDGLFVEQGRHPCSFLVNR
jgi:hypothetical protein